MSEPASPPLSSSQLARLAEIGEERSAPVGELLYRIGDRALSVRGDPRRRGRDHRRGRKRAHRQGPSGFLGELNLLSGQTVFVSALVVEPLRYIAVERGALRSLLTEDGPLSDLVLSTFISRREALQTCRESAWRSSARTARSRRGNPRVRARKSAPVHLGGCSPGGREASLPLVRLPGGGELRGPTPARYPRSRDRARTRTSRGGRPADRRAGPARLGGRGVRRLRRSRHAGHREHRTRRSGRLVPSDRELPRFPAGISGTELTSRAVTQARKFNARTATPYRALALEPETVGTSSSSRTTGRSPLVPSCLQREPSTVASRSTALQSSRD